MINVEWWLDDEFPKRLSWNGYVASEPEINCTNRPFEAMQAGLVSVYNAQHGTTLTVGDFTWTEVPQPEPAEDAAVEPDVQGG
jgi:hypothetical protein